MDLFTQTVLDDGDLPKNIAYPYDLMYFTEDEFKRCTPSCSLLDMNRDFMYQLDMLRSYLRLPIVVTSAYRTIQWEVNHLRSGLSAHCKGLAVDIKVTDSSYRYKLLSVALLPPFEFSRIGIGKDFIHLDMDKDLPQSVIWLYK